MHGAPECGLVFLTARRPRRTRCAGSTSGCWRLQGSLCMCALVLQRRTLQAGHCPGPQPRQHPWAVPCQPWRRKQAARQRCVRRCSAGGGAHAGGAAPVRGAGAGPARRGQVHAHPLPGQALHAPGAVRGQGPDHRRRGQDAPAHLCGVPPGAPEALERAAFSAAHCRSPGRQEPLRPRSACGVTHAAGADVVPCRGQGLAGMVDAAKYADLVLLLVDGAFGFEMETFEFLNILQARGR